MNWGIRRVERVSRIGIEGFTHGAKSEAAGRRGDWGWRRETASMEQQAPGILSTLSHDVAV